MQDSRWGSHESRVEGQNQLPQPAGHTSLDAAQDMVGFLGCKRTLLAHVELLIHQNPQVLLLRAALEPLSVQPVLMFGITLTHVQDLALGLVELPLVPYTFLAFFSPRARILLLLPMQGAGWTSRLLLCWSRSQAAPSTPSFGDADTQLYEQQSPRRLTRGWGNG